MNNKGKDGNVKIGFGTADLVSVTIDKVPISVNSGQLRDAMRAFGEVKNALSVTSGNDGLGSYNVEFKVIFFILFSISVHVEPTWAHK